MKLDSLSEYSQLDRFVKSFPRSPQQSNKLFHSDAEIIQLSQTSFLAISLDIVGDEQSWGLISDFKNLGEHALESALSDLAAVGVTPAGFLQCLIIGKAQSSDQIEAVLSGLNESCQRHGLYLYGGDTASGENLSLHLTVLGHSRTKPISRVGLNKDDFIYTTQKAGRGNALVAQRWLDRTSPVQNERDYLAQARVPESEVIRKYACCMIDSSDGFLNSLDLLVRANSFGIECDLPLDQILHPLALSIQSKHGLSAWSILAGEFGDYELVFAVPKTVATEFEAEYNSSFSGLTRIGKSCLQPEVKLLDKNSNLVAYDASIARNLYRNGSSDQKKYIESFLALGTRLGF